MEPTSQLEAKYITRCSIPQGTHQDTTQGHPHENAGMGFLAPQSLLRAGRGMHPSSLAGWACSCGSGCLGLCTVGLTASEAGGLGPPDLGLRTGHASRGLSWVLPCLLCGLGTGCPERLPIVRAVGAGGWTGHWATRCEALEGLELRLGGVLGAWDENRDQKERGRSLSPKGPPGGTV